MRKTLLTLLICIVSLVENKADISFNPIIQANGITGIGQPDIQMVSEKVIVNLTPDSSHVSCLFRLYNKGKARKIQIGYPNMIYYHEGLDTKKIEPFHVYENDKKIDSINTYIPDSVNLNSGNSKNIPWYLWDSYFNVGETKFIKVEYSLPCGENSKSGYYYFDYLLHTGAGWKDKIDTAVIIVNLDRIDKDLILKVKPSNYLSQDNRLIWRFYDFEPSKDNDLNIRYEKSKGQYDLQLKNKKSPATLWDTTVLSYDMRSSLSLENIYPNDIASVEVISPSDPVLKTKCPGHIDCSNGLVLMHSKQYAIGKLMRLIRAEKKKTNKVIKNISISDFEENYTLILNHKHIDKSELWPEIVSIDESKVGAISIQNLGNNKKEITIKLSKD